MNTTFTDLNASLLRGQQSDVGKRPNQEDRWEIREFQTADGRPATLALIADGIGGHNTGEIASQMAKEMIPTRLTAKPPSASEITRTLKAALEEAGQAIYNASLDDPNRSGMGTTCTAIVVADRRLYLAHVGDSRAHLLRGGELRQLTIDHTWAEEAIRAGRAPEEIRTHPNRGVIMRYLGIDPTVSIDTRYRASASEIADTLAGPLFLEPGDTLMLCSDGVSDSVDTRQMAELMAYPDCQTAADALVSSALKAGASDNVTALVLRLPGGVVAPPAALAPAGKKRRWLPIALAALGLLVVLGIVAVLVLSDRDGRQPAAQLSPTADAAATPTQALAPTAPRPEATGRGVETQAPSAAATASATAAPTLPVVNATGAVTGANPIAGTPASTVTITGTTAASGEPTLVPTYTPVPTWAPNTPTLRATAMPATPGTSPSQPSSTSGGVTLLRPLEGEKIIGAAEFAWQDQSGFALKPGEQYELIVWGLDEDPMRDGLSPVGGTVQTTVWANLTGVEDALRLSSGKTYYWGVRLLSSTGRPIRMLAGGWKFDYDRAAPIPEPPAPGCTGPGCK